jgi:cytoskeletal protein RodZ
MEESIGAKLRQARELRHLNLHQVSESTRVRPHYLEALENDDLSAIPSAAQARGFLGIYAGFLGLDLAELVPAVRRTEPAPPVATSSGSPEIETPSTRTPGRSGILAWAGERWSRFTGKSTPVETVANSDPAAQSEQPTSEPSAQSVPPASEPSAQSEPPTPEPSAQSEVLEIDSSAQRAAPTIDPAPPIEALRTDPAPEDEAPKTDAREPISFDSGSERVTQRSRVAAPLESRIREMFRDATVERVSVLPEAAGDSAPQAERGPQDAASPAPPPVAKKKAAT